MRPRYTLYVLIAIFALFLYLNGINVVNRAAHIDKSVDGAGIYRAKVAKDNVKNREESVPGMTQSGNSAATSKLRVIYNRVPKCGSRSALSLFKTLSVKNGFTVVKPEKDYPYALEEEAQRNISDLISSLQPPFLYHRHVHYIDFARLRGPPVAYINLIRDPVARAVSHFYFRRHGDGIKAQSRLAKPIDDEKNKVTTYDECVLTGHRECDGNWGRFFIVPFFCGHTPKCRSPSRWALEKAKKCVDENYLVVGIVEEFDGFTKVLEKLLPNFFKGAYKSLTMPDPSLPSKLVRSRTRNKKQPSKETIAIAKKRMSLEYEFYDFVKQRFHSLKKELNI